MPFPCTAERRPVPRFGHHVWTLHLTRIVHSGLPVACCCFVFIACVRVFTLGVYFFFDRKTSRAAS